MMNRHARLLLAASVLALAACTPRRGADDAQAFGIIDQIALTELRGSPELAARLSAPEEMFGGPYLDLFDDRSLAAVQSRRVVRLQALQSLAEASRLNLSSEAADALSEATIEMQALAQIDRHGLGDVGMGDAAPYFVSPIDGAYLALTGTLRRPVRTREDADRLLSRLAALAPAIEADALRLEAEILAGSIPPRWIIDATLAEVRRRRDSRGDMSAFVAAAAAIPGLSQGEASRIGDEAAVILSERIEPAFIRLEKALGLASTGAPKGPGVWALPGGEAYYQDVLALYAGASLTTSEHIQIAEAILARERPLLEAALDSLGVPGTTAAARIAQLYAISPNAAADSLTAATVGTTPNAAGSGPATPPSTSAPGDVAAAAVRQALATTHPLLARLSSVSLSPLEVRLVPGPEGGRILLRAAEGAGATSVSTELAGAFELPVWRLPTLAAREGIPGRHLLRAAERARTSGRLFDRLSTHSAFEEGWCAYASDLAAELGAYGSDAAARVGHHHQIMLDAALLVLDIRIHQDKQSREDAITWLIETTGLAPALAARHIDRVILRPGEAAAAVQGRERLHLMRNATRKALGDAFDLAAFHDVVLEQGPRRLDNVQMDLDAWIAALTRPQIQGDRNR